MCLINRTKTKERILQLCNDTRPHIGITRVSKEALDDIELMLSNHIRRLVETHPSKGVTFRTR